MDTLITIIISGMATGFLVELLSLVFPVVISRLVFALPINFALLYFAPIYPIVTIAVSALAATFFVLTVLRLFDKPVVLDQRRRL